MSILVFIVILGVIIFSHEFGHFITAKKSGIRVDEFGFGFPPKLFGKKIGETEYTFNLLPIGGFVKIFGERPDKESMSGPDAKRSFINKPKYIQAAVLVAGVVFNIILAWVLFVVIFVIGGAPYSADGYIPKGGIVLDPVLTVVDVEKNSPTYMSGMRPGDKPLRFTSQGDIVDDITVIGIYEFVSRHPFDPITIDYTRNEIEYTVTVQPEKDDESGRYMIGIRTDNIGKLTPLPLSSALFEGVDTTLFMTKSTAINLAAFFTDLARNEADLEEVSGPVGIVGHVNKAVGIGFIAVLSLTAVISISLALINLLPFPALDGGRLFFLLIEVIIKKPIKPQVANIVNSIGFFLLLLLMAVITYNDVIKMF